MKQDCGIIIMIISKYTMVINLHFPFFQSTFPRIYPVPDFNILKKENKERKTPLQMAIEKGNIGFVHLYKY